MILRRVLVSALALTALGLGVYAYNEHEARLAAEDLARSLQAKNLSMHKSLAEKKAAPPAKEAVFPAGVTAAENPDAPGEGRGRMNGGMRGAADFFAMLDSPEAQQLMALRSRGILDSRYATLFKNLNLPPEQLKKFQDLLLDKQSTLRDVISAMRSQGLTPSPENRDQIRTLVQNANTEIDSQIQSTLGDAAFAQYKDYESTQPQRATVDRVQQRLSYSSQPLTDQQATQLVSLLAQNPPATTGNSNGGGNGGGGGGLRQLFNGGGNATAPISDQAIQQATSILSPAQVSALQDLQQEQQAQAQLARQARANFTNQRAAPAAPAAKTQ